jgi:hypothetical protein
VRTFFFAMGHYTNASNAVRAIDHPTDRGLKRRRAKLGKLF